MEAVAPVAHRGALVEFQEQPQLAEAVATPLPSTSSNEPDVPAGDVVGRVILMDAPQNEAPDFDLCRVLARILWLLLLVALPVLFLRQVLVKLEGVSILLALVALMMLLHFLRPTSLLSLLGLTIGLTRGVNRTVEHIPVRYFRVRMLHDDSEASVRLKGAYARGNVSPDDVVTFWGTWRDGVLMARRGYNHRTHSHIAIRRSHSWVYLLLSIVCIGCVITYFYEPAATLLRRIQQMAVPL
jgi:hypothetical protein